MYNNAYGGWEGGQALTENSTKAGYDDWRQPTIAEFEMLFEAIGNPTRFPSQLFYPFNDIMEYYWTSDVGGYWVFCTRDNSSFSDSGGLHSIWGVRVATVAIAGDDQVVFDKAILDGSQSFDLNGVIVSYSWDADLNADGTYEVNVGGEETVLLTSENLQALGLFGKITEIQLTVIDNDGKEGRDRMLLAVAGWPQSNTGFALEEFKIAESKKTGNTTLSIGGAIDLPELGISDGDVVESRTTVELFGVLPDGGDLIVSGKADLQVKIKRNSLIISK